MAIIKCKMCGGDLNLIAEQSVAECEYCGSMQTVPSADSEKKLTLFARANRLRAACDFDKASGIYESIVADFPEEAEAYWGLVLCKYGIEYVDDPSTGKKIPTCHRSSYDSVMDDSNLEQALENADLFAQKLYREEAKQLERIRKGILDVSSAEQPYDIFICYKETDEKGERTLDSVLAQDLYTALTDKGYRVFFSRITLQGKLGEAYEPYIFAALNSAKVMLAVGTCYEYYNAVWVKNEWSRYLKTCETDTSKHLIPCFRDLDPQDMPKEFKHLQGVNLGKMGSIQDILFNMEKYIALKIQTVVQERTLVDDNIERKIATLLDRGNMALEDFDWDKADSFFEEVLNNDSKNAQAYLGKALAQAKCRTLATFIQKRLEATPRAKTQTLRLKANEAHIEEMVQKYSLPGFVDPDTIRNLYSFDLFYHSEVGDRKSQYKNEESYWSNHRLLSRVEQFASGSLAESFEKEKATLFDALSKRIANAEQAKIDAEQSLQQRYTQHLQTADVQAQTLYETGIQQRESLYQTLLSRANSYTDVSELIKTARSFDCLGNYQDSIKMAEYCRMRADEEEKKQNAEHERQLIQSENEKKLQKAKTRKICIISAIIITIIAIFVIIVTIIIPNRKYNEAVALMNAEEYEKAIIVFDNLNGYKDSIQQLALCEHELETKEKDKAYDAAIALMDSGKYEEAISEFTSLNGYKSSVWQIAVCKSKIKEIKNKELYNTALAFLDAEKYEEAIATLKTLIDNIDNPEQNLDYKYKLAEAYQKSGDIKLAAIHFGKLNNYQDSYARSMELWNSFADRKTLSSGTHSVFAITTSGNVVTTEYEKYHKQLLEAKNIIAVSDGNSHCLGLKIDGTVIATGRDGYIYSDYGNVDNWENIVSIYAGYETSFGIRNDGTVVAVGYNDHGKLNVEDWTDIVDIAFSDTHTVGLRADGTVIAVGNNDSNQCNVEDWTDIIAISASSGLTVGLKDNGTVVFAGDNNADGQLNINDWVDIVAIESTGYHTVGIKSDGTVVTSSPNSDGIYDIHEWTNIVNIVVNSFSTIGIKADGTVVATGNNDDGQLNMNDWTDIIAIETGLNYNVGLKADGTVVVAGNTRLDNISRVLHWSNLKLPTS